MENRVDETMVAAYLMPRPRIDTILDAACKCKLVYVVGGAGFGKSQAVRHYIEKQANAVVRWMSLSESDNIGARYWENLTYQISLDNPDLAAKLRALGFPDTLERFKQFSQVLKDSEHRANKTFLVLDEFQVIHSEQALIFAERCAHLNIPGACVILISRKEPQINAVSLFAQNKACIITQEQLYFSPEELFLFFKQRSILLSKDDLPRLMEATKGWGMAVQLLYLVMKKSGGNIAQALDTMKQNVFLLMESEAFNAFPESAQKELVKMSLVPDLPPMLLSHHFDNLSSILDSGQLDLFIYFDKISEQVKIHPLYLEFLLSKQDVLSDEEQLLTYRQAASFCLDNDFHLDALKYLARSRQIAQMTDIILSYPFKFPTDTCAYILDILLELEESEENKNEHAVLLLNSLFIPLLLLWLNRLGEAKERCWDIIREWTDQDAPLGASLLHVAYSNLAYISVYSCTVTHVYDFHEHLAKAMEYYKHIKIPPLGIAGSFAVADLRSFACLPGKEATLADFEAFFTAVSKAVSYIEKSPHRMYYGYDELAQCEFFYYQNRLGEAAKYAHQAIQKAREQKQSSIEAMAAFYLFHIALHGGDYALAKETLRQGQGASGSANFWNRHFYFNMVEGILHAHIELSQKASSWVLADEMETTFDVHVPTRELIYSVKYQIAAKNYKRALTILTSSYPRDVYERFLFGELSLTLLSAAMKLRCGDESAAVADFVSAYKLSQEGLFEMPFVELGKDMLPLATAVLAAQEQGIPIEWLKIISRKASAYAKKLSVSIALYKKEMRIEDAVRLSERELQVLSDIYHGLSREEIAALRYLSINTVKKILQSIFIKLDAQSSVDAVRIGLERKLIE